YLLNVLTFLDLGEYIHYGLVGMQLRLQLSLMKGNLFFIFVQEIF
ncbi:hypothetical protein CP02DC18_1110, partial [Chlamydia psittaci 02DC18]